MPVLLMWKRPTLAHVLNKMSNTQTAQVASPCSSSFYRPSRNINNAGRGHYFNVQIMALGVVIFSVEIHSV